MMGCWTAKPAGQAQSLVLQPPAHQAAVDAALRSSAGRAGGRTCAPVTCSLLPKSMKSTSYLGAVCGQGDRLECVVSGEACRVCGSWPGSSFHIHFGHLLLSLGHLLLSLCRKHPQLRCCGLTMLQKDSPMLTGSAAYAFSTLARYHCLSAELCARHFSPALSGACGCGLSSRRGGVSRRAGKRWPQA